MYLFFTIFFVFLLFFVCFNFWRRKKIIKKICSMCMKEKCHLLDELIKPFGYSYVLSQDIFTSRIDAWQRDFGYCALFDKAALHFNMVFDCLPVYFPYRNKTWMIEFWKGQYGINTGAEIGIYHTDTIVPPENYKTTMFDGISDKEMLPCSFMLYDKTGDYIRISDTHWWLTAFLTGRFSNPSDLCMENSITFPNMEMLSAFIEGMYHAGYSPKDFQIYGLRLCFTFCEPQNEEHTLYIRFWSRFSQWKNRIFCKIYLWITRPFCNTEDRILYLYYYLPFAFRKILRLHRFNKRCHRKKRCMRRKI